MRSLSRRALAAACALGLVAGGAAVAPAAHAQDAGGAVSLDALTNPSVLSVTRDPATKDLKVSIQNNTPHDIDCQFYVYEKPVILAILGDVMKDPSSIVSDEFSAPVQAKIDAAYAAGKGFSDHQGSISPGTFNYKFGTWSTEPQPTNTDWTPNGIAGCNEGWVDGDGYHQQQFLLLAPKSDVNPMLGSLAGVAAGMAENAPADGTESPLAGSAKSMITPQFIFGGNWAGSL